jgi:hypothetical protein
MKKYFHELTNCQRNKLDENLTYEELAAQFPQPPWCTYPDAISYLGCWSLTGGIVKSEEYCKQSKCEFWRETK